MGHRERQRDTHTHRETETQREIEQGDQRHLLLVSQICILTIETVWRIHSFLKLNMDHVTHLYISLEYAQMT